MTYARSRLWLGITGVGTMVVIATVGLVLGVPGRWLGTGRSGAAALVSIYAVYALVSLPFDLLGGYWLPCRHHRVCLPLAEFLIRWLRGVLVQGVCMVAIGSLLLAAGRWGGRGASLTVVLGLMLLLLHAQEPLARLLGGLRIVPGDLAPVRTHLASWRLASPELRFLASTDPGFVGGLVGLPGRERLVLPRHWLAQLLPDELAAQVARRVGALRTGTRRRGVLLALAWNAVGYLASSFLPGADPRTVAGLLTTALGFTLWSFLGLLLLPSLSRPGVHESDGFALRAGVPLPVLKRTMEQLDQLQDDEPARPALVESIFHPIPSLEWRVRRLEQAEAPWGAWHANRMALYLSWAGLGLLSRAVHCNAGRPELWVLYPGD